MPQTVCIGNQTAHSASRFLDPFEFALVSGLDVFEWYADPKLNEDGTVGGWELFDMGESQRREIKRIGQSRQLRYTVHAPWQANPLHAEDRDLLDRSLEFAHAIGAYLVNLHLYLEQGAEAYVAALAPLIARAARLDLKLSLENTPQTAPSDCNAAFACLRSAQFETDHVGMCLDLGHANLCHSTRNDYVRYLDELDPAVPIIHLHVHENYGDQDAHLPLFTGPAAADDGGVRVVIACLKQRGYSGAMILEQWPEPPTLLLEADERLRQLWGLPPRGGGFDPS